MIHVVAAAVIDATGQVLIAQRPVGKHLAGGWEFPGGKLEPGETRVAGLARELREELGIEVMLARVRPLMRLRHRYPYGEVLLDMFVVRHYSGMPSGRDGQAIRWCSFDELPHADLLPADRPIVAALCLPERLTAPGSAGAATETETETPDCLVANRAAADQPLGGVICVDARDALRAVAGGASFIVMRSVINSSALAELCAEVSVPVYARGIEIEAAWALGATGVA